MEEVIEQLKALRRAKGWTQEELAGQLGVALRTQRAVGGRRDQALRYVLEISPEPGGEGWQEALRGRDHQVDLPGGIPDPS